MRMVGIEPTTFRLKVERSTTELHPPINKILYYFSWPVKRFFE